MENSASHLSVTEAWRVRPFASLPPTRSRSRERSVLLALETSALAFMKMPHPAEAEEEPKGLDVEQTIARNRRRFTPFIPAATPHLQS